VIARITDDRELIPSCGNGLISRSPMKRSFSIWGDVVTSGMGWWLVVADAKTEASRGEVIRVRVRVRATSPHQQCYARDKAALLRIIHSLHMARNFSLIH
jgi:hypothetical protein